MSNNQTKSPSSASPNNTTAKARRSRTTRAAHPAPMQMTAQRQQILEAVLRYQVLKRDQIQRIAGYACRNSVNYALGQLYHHGYVERRFAPPLLAQADEDYQAFYLLDRKGAEFLAAQQRLPNVHTLGWKPQDKTIQWWHLHHLIACNEFLIQLHHSAQAINCQLDWLNERALRQPERKAHVTVPEPHGRSTSVTLVADTYIVLTRSTGQTLAFFVECDRGTVAIAQRWVTKVRGYEVFLNGSAYRQHFLATQHTAGVLTVTINAQRLAHLKSATETATHASSGGAFLFTTFTDLAAANVLTDPIWHASHRTGQYALLPTSASVRPSSAPLAQMRR